MTKSAQELQAVLKRMQQLPHETEWFEFKEAKQNFDFDDLGKYFSSLSNEANLHGEPAGWLVFGVNDKAVVVGSQFRPHLDSLKHEIAKKTSNNHTFVEIYELQEAAGRIILFQIPPAPAGMPIAWMGHFYGRDGDSLVPLNMSEIEQIRRQQFNEDWSIQVVANATLKDLHPAAIAQARANFKQGKQNRAGVAGVDDWDDAIFLDRARLTVAGKITRTAILLVGRPEAAALLSPAPAQISWRLEGEQKAYEHFGPPFLQSVNDVFRRIRNVRFRLQPFGQLIPVELEKYDATVVLEALNNCIAHQDYTLQSRVVVTEFSDRLLFENAGTFFEGTVEDYVLTQKTPQHYRNPFLAHAMVNLNMIDTMGYGIQRMFAEQRKRFFPLPDYDLSQPDQVRLVIHGKLLDENYSRILISQAELPLHLVMALDRVQKKLPIPDERIAELRRLKLVEGRKPNLFPASKLAAVAGSKAEYVRFRAFDDAHYKDMIQQYIVEFSSASRSDIDRLLQDKLSDSLDPDQKRHKIQNLLAAMKKEGIIARSGPKQTAVWKLEHPGPPIPLKNS